MNLIAKNNNSIIRIYKETSPEPRTAMSQEKRKICFVLMPFSDNMKEVYDKAIKPACDKAGFDSLRVDELKGAFNINRKIIEYIFNSDAIIADLTKWNPNVFYEMGVAHAIDNKTIMIIQKKSKLPFDVSGYKCIRYTQSEDGLEELKGKISESLRGIEEWRRYPTNPVQEFKPQDSPQIFMEETSLDPLLWHIRYRRKENYRKNPVELDYLGLSCKTIENKGRFDVQLTYRMKGKNIKDEILPGLQLVVAGDTPVPLAKLNARLYHLHIDPQKRNYIRPDLLGADGKLKILFLPFISPGIEKNATFDIELSYTWPNLVYSDSPKDCFFLDNFDFELGARELQIELEFDGLKIGAVNAFAVDSSLREQRLGAISADNIIPSKFIFRRINPEKDKYYILVFDILEIS